MTSGLLSRSGSPRFGLLLLLCAMVTPLASRAVAAPPALLFVESDLADLRPDEATGFAWSVTPRADVTNALCAEQPDAPARIALVSRRMTRRQRDGCAAASTGKLGEWLIGWRALFAMTGGAPFPLTSEILYRALANTLPRADGVVEANHAARWRDLDPSLPDAPIRVLLPQADSIESRILIEIILYEGCSAHRKAALPTDPIVRFTVCTSVRADGTVTRGPAQPSVASWLRQQGASAVALIGIATLLAEPDLDTALPLDGVMPGFATIADGRYRAVLPLYLETIAPRHAMPVIAGIAGALFAETAFGPLGTLPRQGLAPLAAADRVKLRLRLGRELEDDAD